ncbi:glycosyltransferase family 4 protein [Mucisphaera calidilacus]|uniref:Glycosyltransferase EpsD n=1 Tax=Mucisphaera calidilacus TaxID=2527982 RepID=A0A518BXN9_9BACT|nr:glycosyltransferase family 4 protein [Mucisphaera calidilacus]QDU71741.1 Putative glycosyltransferase EpsD [Mucisphaera calidilacus]
MESFDAGKGGAERSTEQIVRELMRRGHEVTLLTGYCAPGSVIEGVAIEAASDRRLKTASSVRRYRLFVEQRLDAGAFDTSLSVTTLAPAAVVEPRAGIYSELHRASLRWQASAAGRLVRWLGQKLSPKQRAMLAGEHATLGSDRVRRWVAISRFMRDQMIGRGVDPDRISLIPNSAERPTADAGARLRVREAWGLSDGDVAFVFPAHAPRRKGVVPLLAALARLKSDRVRLVMVGAVDDGLRRLAERGGKAPRVVWAGVSKDMGAVYAAADVTVLPSYYDPASKIVAESLLAGVPVITTRTNGACDLVVPGGVAGVADDRWRGRVIDDADDVASLARAMEELTDDAERSRCAEAAMAVEEVCSMRWHVDGLEPELERAASH